MHPNPTDADFTRAAFDVSESEIDDTLESLRILAERVNRGPGGREVALAITKLQEARYWLEDARRQAKG